MKTQDALREYIKNSERKVIIDGVFCARMSHEIAKKFDDGEYDVRIDEHKKYIMELNKLKIQYPGNAKPMFYMYIVPDEDFIELLHYPYKDRRGGGRPVNCYDLDGFNTAYGVSQNVLTVDRPVSIEKHVNTIHEYAHLIQQQFGFGDGICQEGFAELIPWYVLEYEIKVPNHYNVMRSMTKIYTANELLESVSFSDTVPNMTCSFQPSYMSSYLWVRAIVEHIRVKYNLSRAGAVQKFLELYKNIKFMKQWFVKELANEIGMDTDKLLNSTEYQVAELNNIKTENAVKNMNLGGREK